MLRSLIRQGAAEGSFDRVLAADTPEAIEFFAKLKRALVSGYFVEEDPKTGRVEAVAVPGYVFWPDGRGHGKALLEALLDTPPGKKTWVVRIPRGSRYAAAVQHLLKPFGFAAAGDTAQLRWFLRRNAPAAVAVRVNSALGAHPPVN